MPKYKIDDKMQADLNNRFTYHTPHLDQPDRYEYLRNLGKDLAEEMCKSCPPSRELSLALTSLQQSVYWANTAIACNETYAEFKPVAVEVKQDPHAHKPGDVM